MFVFLSFIGPLRCLNWIPNQILRLFCQNNKSSQDGGIKGPVDYAEEGEDGGGWRGKYNLVKWDVEDIEEGKVKVAEGD